MSVVWLVILVIYGLVMGFEHVNGLAWWLLLPLWVQDVYDRKGDCK